MRAFLLMQLTFNVLILVSLIALARRPARRSPSKSQGRRARRWTWSLPPLNLGLHRTREAAAKTPPRGPREPAEALAAAPAHLAKLVEAAEHRELLAEAELRERLARFRTGATG